jgi:probable phosphoglycerate mutase
MDLVIVRHARPVSEPPGATPADPPLSPTGQAQAAATADLLAAEPIDHIVASTMRRAIETAAPLAERIGLTIETLVDLEESDRSRTSYTPAEEMGLDHPVVQQFLADPESVFDGDYTGFRDRIQRGFDTVIANNRGRTVAVYCHGMVMGVYLQVLLGHDDPLAVRHDYCGIMRVTASSSGLRTLRSANETGHLRHLAG